MHGITEEQLVMLDLFEGEDYERIEVKVQETKTGAWFPCQVYIFLDHDQLLTTVWSFEEFQTDCSHRWTDETDDREYEMLRDTTGIGRRRRNETIA